MEESVDKTVPKAAYTITLETGTYRFRRPTTPQLDRYLSRAQGKLVSAGKTLTLELVEDADREAWTAALERKPGLSTGVITEIMDDLGFTGEVS